MTKTRAEVLSAKYRRCSSRRLLTLRVSAVREEDAEVVRLIDEEIPHARRDEADDSATLSAYVVFTL